LVIYFQTSISHVGKYEIFGNKLLSDKEILKLADLNKKESFLTLSSKKVEQKLENKRIVENAVVKKIFPNTIKITVKEYHVIGQANISSDTYALLANGFLTKEIKNDNQLDVPIFTNWEQGDELQEMASELNKLPESIFHSISEIVYTPTPADSMLITLYTNEGFEVQTTIREFAKRMSNYPSIIKEIPKDQKGVIHLEVGAYFAPFEDNPKK
jgi:cell division protein FtsQ